MDKIQVKIQQGQISNWTAKQIIISKQSKVRISSHHSKRKVDRQMKILDYGNLVKKIQIQQEDQLHH